VVMIGENHHLADSATLNKHRKVPSEASTGPLPILANHTLLNHHHPLPLLTNVGWYGLPFPPFLGILQNFKRATSKQQLTHHVSPIPSYLTPSAEHEYPALLPRARDVCGPSCHKLYVRRLLRLTIQGQV